MIQEIYPRKFDNHYRPDVTKEPDDIVFFFDGNERRNDRILAAEAEGEISFPTAGELKQAGVEADTEFIYLFSIDERKFFLGMTACKIPKIKAYEFMPIKVLRKNSPGHLCFAGMTAYHLFSWYRESRFCGRCGHSTIMGKKERLMECPACGNLIFPKIAPAVIIGLKNGDSIMMSRYAGREYKGRALLAGFCEIGETPEQTVEREVFEEVGLKVKNITYFASQPWGFDSNLLLGYFAELDGGDDITLDTDELASAGFVKREDIEADSNTFSLTATMIEAFRLGKDVR